MMIGTFWWFDKSVTSDLDLDWWARGMLTVLTTLPDLSITAIVWPSGAITSNSRRRLSVQGDHSSESLRSTVKARKRRKALVNKVPLVGANSRQSRCMRIYEIWDIKREDKVGDNPGEQLQPPY